MAEKAHARWTVLPHGPLERIGDDLWRAEGTIPSIPLRRVMAVVRRADGRLLIHNAIALDAAQMDALDALGPVAQIAVPNGGHRLDAAIFKQRYPRAAVLCPAAARGKVAEVVAVDGTYEEQPPDPEIGFEVVAGMAGQEGAVVVRKPEGTTLILNDAVFNMPHLPGVKGFILRHLTASSGGPKVSRLASFLLVKDRAAFRRDLERFAALPDLRRVLVAHHETIDRDPAAVLRAVAATLV